MTVRDPGHKPDAIVIAAVSGVRGNAIEALQSRAVLRQFLGGGSSGNK